MGREGWVVKEKLCGFNYNSCGVYRLLQMIGFSCSREAVQQSLPVGFFLLTFRFKALIYLLFLRILNCWTASRC